MSITREQRDRLLAFYDGVGRWMQPAVQSLTSEAEPVLASGRDKFERLIDYHRF